jgi:HTH-type transcriptional regulator, transcriptional repressor of NAD biosynthesis genes
MLKVAILGGECSGKTRLARDLLAHYRQQGAAPVLVDEYLRQWCSDCGRTPLAHEQAAIAAEQARRIDEACQNPKLTLLLADTTPLITAIYSDLLFGDVSLYDCALAHQRQYNLNLLCAPDLLWVADGNQRDGVQARQAVDHRLRQVLAAQGLAVVNIQGAGSARLNRAVLACGQASNSKIDSKLSNTDAGNRPI